jgi:beta-glucosidase
VLELKERLGLFEAPYGKGSAGGVSPARMAEHRQAARAAARRSIVLLQDREGLLPAAAPARVAVIGPLADAREEMLGPWSGAGRVEDMVTILEGLRAAWPASELKHAAGAPITGGEDEGIADARRLAGEADLVVLCLGESRFMSGEAGSRACPGLPGRQEELLHAVLDAGRPTVVLLTSGRPLVSPRLFERAGTVLALHYLGSEAGNAVGDILSGRANPCGRLAASWPVDVGQIPVYFSRLPTGRPLNAEFRYSSKYLDLPNAPQFPFGHGLGFTRFTLGAPAVGVAGDRVTVEAAVANAGARPGAATIFLFIRDPVASVAQPTLALRRFARVELAPGGETMLRFELGRDDLALLDADLRPAVEPGAFEVHLGLSADPAGLRSARFRFG